MKRWSAIGIICSSACFVGAIPAPSDIPQSPFRLDLAVHSTRTRWNSHISVQSVRRLPSDGTYDVLVRPVHPVSQDRCVVRVVEQN
jgi:hypothetical protein